MSDRRHRWLVWGMFVFSILGFLDAAYLTVEHFLNRVPPCSVVSGCEVVTTGPYSVLFGIPVALLGSLYYLAIILALVFYFDRRRDWVLRVVSCFTAAGFLFTLYLVYLMIFVIHAICTWCLLSALSSTALFILGLMVLKSHRVFERRLA